MFDISASVPPFLLAAVGFPPGYRTGQCLQLVEAGIRIDLSADLYKGFRLTHSPELVRSCHIDPLHISCQHRSDAGQVNEPFYTATPQEMNMASRMLTGDQISAPVTLFSKLLKSGPPGKSRLCLPPYRLVL